MISRRVFLGSILGGLCAGPCAVWGQTSSKELIRVVYHPGVPPYSFQSGLDKQPRGILVDLVKLMGQSIDFDLTHQTFPWQRAQENVRFGSADAFCGPETPARRDYVYFVPTPLTTLASPEIFFPKNSPYADEIRQIRKKEDLYRFSVASFIGNSSDDTVWKNHPSRVRVNDIEQIFKLMLHGRVDFYFADPWVTKFKMKQAALLRRFDSVPGDFILPMKLRYMKLALRKSYPHARKVVGELDRAIQATLTQETRQQVIDQYIQV